MNPISPIIPLILGIAAGTLFLLVLICAWIVTMRNRKKIHKYAANHSEENKPLSNN